MADIELPVFPLPLVLFPSIPQSLHIFEPRYRHLVTDCLAGDRRFGLSLLHPRKGESDTPQPGHIGCSAIIQSHQSLPNGRSNILIVGEHRYVFKRLLNSDRLYFVGMVEPFYDQSTSDPLLSDITAKVAKLFEEFVKSGESAESGLAEPLSLPNDPELLSYHVSAALPIDLAAKEDLLRLTSTTARLERLRNLLKPLMGQAARRRSVQRLAKRNGKTHAVPTVSTE